MSPLRLTVLLGWLLAAALPAVAQDKTPALGAFHVQPLPWYSSTASMDFLVSPDGRFLYRGTTAYDLDPATGAVLGPRTDLFQALPSTDDNGDKWALTLFALSPVQMDKLFTAYLRTPSGSSSFTEYVFFLQDRDPQTGAFGAPTPIATIQKGRVTSWLSAGAVSADGNCVAARGTISPPGQDAKPRMVTVTREASGTWRGIVEDPPGGTLPITNLAQPFAFLNQNKVVLGYASSHLYAYLNDPAGVPAWADRMPLYWQRVPAAGDVRTILTDSQRDRLVLVPSVDVGAIQLYTWDDLFYLVHQKTLFDPLLMSTTAMATSGDGNLLASAHANRLRLWRWNRDALDIELIDDEAYPYGRFVFEALMLSPNGTRLYAMGRTQGDIGELLLACIRIEPGATARQVVDAVLSGTDNPAAMDANADGVLDAADAVTAGP